MSLTDPPRRALHLSVGLIDLAQERRRSFASRLDEIARRGEERLNGRNGGDTQKPTNKRPARSTAT